MSPVSRLNTWDYVSLSLVVTASCIVGLYHVYAARKTKSTSTKQFLVSSHELGLFPLTLSTVATALSAIGMLGFPVEFYMNGINFYFIIVAIIIGIPIGSHLFLPVFFKLDRFTIFEYLELRFCKAIRIAASIMLTVQMLLYSSCVVYAPALAVNQVTGLDLWASVVSIGIACIIYTSLGGIKAVVWADVMQCLAMTAVLLLIVIRAAINIGGFGVVWDRLVEGKRADILIWSSSPYSQYTFWTTTVAGTFNSLIFITLTQPLMQRYLSSRTLRRSQISLMAGASGFAFSQTLIAIAALLMYASYHNCDPLLSGRVTSRDQMMTLFALETLSFCNGLPGVFIGGIMCATLSTLSSNLNSLTAITLSDYVKSLKPDLSEEWSMKLSRILVVLYGGLCIALVAVAKSMGGVVKYVYGIYGITGGPIVAIFTIGMLVPWVNSKGAGIGFLCSMIVPLWAWIGNCVTTPTLAHAPVSHEGCSNSTTATTVFANTEVLSLLEQFYSLSSIWYASWSLVTGLLVSVIASTLTGFQKAKDVDPNLLFPFVGRFIHSRKVNKQNQEASQQMNGIYRINENQLQLDE